jgi:hypothetical protein
VWNIPTSSAESNVRPTSPTRSASQTSNSTRIPRSSTFERARSLAAREVDAQHVVTGSGEEQRAIAGAAPDVDSALPERACLLELDDGRLRTSDFPRRAALVRDGEERAHVGIVGALPRPEAGRTLGPRRSRDRPRGRAQAVVSLVLVLALVAVVVLALYALSGSTEPVPVGRS